MSSYSPNPTAAAQPAVTVRRSRRRIGILALLAIGTMINYLDRTVLGIAAPKLTAELGIDPAIMGILFSAFAWTYALAQIPGGLFLDRFGNKVTYFLSLTLWSLFTLFHGMAVGLKTLLLWEPGADHPAVDRKARRFANAEPEAAQQQRLQSHRHAVEQGKQRPQGQ